ncbi:MAG: DNA primase [Hyphomicrobiaceae bacterium]
MRFDDHFLDEIRARLPVSQVVGRRVQLKKKGREYAGLSPFKQEKSASFFVNDQKGFYHCFASGEHGDIFKFLMTTEGLSFPEAVERLAGEAGVPMPVRSEYARERDEQVRDERQRLYDLLDASATFFRQQLGATVGGEARRYIDKRGLKRDTIATFQLGFAPNSKTALKEHLAKLGFSVGEMVTSGMLIGGDDIPVPYDRFRNRVMFPIADLKGRAIAFGGRALDPSAPAKYLNSPETPLFHKGSVLFNASRARPAAHEGGRIIVVEGYMDVVALAEAGFADAVAPLGTALTEDQVRLLWRFVPEPTLCFDGDSAGRKAAFRAIDTVLPHLKPGYSVSFAFLPDGLDPDDLVRQRGAEAMAGILKASRPLVDVLFERETAAGDTATPERRAKLEQRLKELIGGIVDPAVRGHYERDIRGRLFQVMRAAGQSGGSGTYVGSAQGGQGKSAWKGNPRPGGGKWNGKKDVGPAQAGSSLRNSAMAVASTVVVPQREALLLRAAINHPWLIEEHAEALAELPLTSEALLKLREGLLSAHAGEKTLDSNELRYHLQSGGFASTLVAIEQMATHRRDRFAEVSSDRNTVEEGWLHACALHQRTLGLRRSLEAAEKAWHDDPSPEVFGTIVELQQRLALESQHENTSDETIG